MPNATTADAIISLVHAKSIRSISEGENLEEVCERNEKEKPARTEEKWDGVEDKVFHASSSVSSSQSIKVVVKRC